MPMPKVICDTILLYEPEHDPNLSWSLDFKSSIDVSLNLMLNWHRWSSLYVLSAESSALQPLQADFALKSSELASPYG